MTGSQRSLKDQVKETISDLPIHVARLAVAGVGRIMMLGDRLRKDAKDAGDSNFTPVVDRLRDDAKQAATRIGDDAKQIAGKVGGRLFGTEPPEEDDDEKPAPGPEISIGKPKAEPEPKPEAEPKPNAEAKPKPKAKAGPKPETEEEVTAADLPVPAYHQASLASVRARLRLLDEGQVVQLRDYERSHAAREDFLRMYENRLVKLRAE
jgi:hypothetical protein